MILLIGQRTITQNIPMKWIRHTVAQIVVGELFFYRIQNHHLLQNVKPFKFQYAFFSFFFTSIYFFHFLLVRYPGASMKTIFCGPWHFFCVLLGKIYHRDSIHPFFSLLFCSWSRGNQRISLLIFCYLGWLNLCQEGHGSKINK